MNFIVLTSNFVFLTAVIEPLLIGDSLVDYLWETINPILTEGLTMVKIIIFDLYRSSLTILTPFESQVESISTLIFFINIFKCQA